MEWNEISALGIAICHIAKLMIDRKGVSETGNRIYLDTILILVTRTRIYF